MLLAVLLVVCPPVMAAAELVDRVLAVVSGTIITLSDARAAVELGFVDTRNARDPVGTALDWLIDRRLVLDEAARYEWPEPDMVSIEAVLWSARRRFPTDAAWAAAMRRLGLTEEGIRALAADTLVVDAFVDRRFSAGPAPSDADLQVYIDRHRAEFVRDGLALTLEDARPLAEARVRAERREQSLLEWVGRLRRRADVSVLYTSGR